MSCQFRAFKLADRQMKMRQNSNKIVLIVTDGVPIDDEDRVQVKNFVCDKTNN